MKEYILERRKTLNDYMKDLGNTKKESFGDFLTSEVNFTSTLSKTGLGLGFLGYAHLYCENLYKTGMVEKAYFSPDFFERGLNMFMINSLAIPNLAGALVFATIAGTALGALGTGLDVGVECLEEKLTPNN